MAETPKRLAPTKQTVFQLGARSGNECAFPGCMDRMFNERGELIGEVCHIEAAEPKGERFNAAMTNEQRRHISNLMMMCHPHHVVTNNVAEYPTPKLQAMKQTHEARFTTAPQQLLLMLKDWSQHSAPTFATNLNRLNRVLGWRQSDAELQVATAELAAYTQVYARVPQQVREFLKSVVERTALMEGTRAVVETNSWGTYALLAQDYINAFRVSDRVVADYGKMLDAYGIGGVEGYVFDRATDQEQYGIAIYSLNSGWPLWTDLYKFSQETGTPFESLAVFGDFSVLDE